MVSVKMTVPLILCILPSLLAVVVGPAVAMIVEARKMRNPRGAIRAAAAGRSSRSGAALVARVRDDDQGSRRRR